MCDLLTATLEISGHFTARLGRRTASTRTTISGHFTARLGRRTASARTATLVSAVGRPRLARRFPVISPLVSAVGRPHLALPRSPWPSDGPDSHDDFRSFYRPSRPAG